MINIKRDKSTQVVFILTVIAAATTLVCAAADILIPMYLKYKFHSNEIGADSVGIIGGADGPTAIYITSQFSSHLFTVIFALLTVTGVLYLIFKNKWAK
ncbi:MAG: sodium ion-translocating decarboxylase subunit beta [Desulfitobacteriaceae bacterium]|nr:sodium ion-translocating decarboxylase subunit beta [Desulfitobacteriaceae bacterium]MDD4751889.1 sodium ion-translocating decarboxylase subunit beta [Desulfitobacteriaceae bacterium]